MRRSTRAGVDRLQRRMGFEGVGMSPELRESRAALILLAAVVVSVLIFGAVTLFSQIG